MQTSHVIETIRPIVSDAVTRRRAMRESVEEDKSTFLRLEKHLRIEIARIFKKQKGEFEFFDAAQHAAYIWNTLDDNASRKTMVLKIDLELSCHEGVLKPSQIEQLRDFYEDFERRCRTVFSSIHKLEIEFNEV